MPFRDKTILTVMMQWDYGKRERGESLEKVCFFRNLSECAACVEPLWIDDYLHKKDELQKLIISKADEVRPDLIFFIPCRDEFFIETLEYLKARYTTYAWFGDDQWRFDDYTRKYAPHYTFVSTTDPWSVSKYQGLGIKPIVTQWAGQPYSANIGPLADSETYKYDVSFVGGCNPFRKWFINNLSKRGIFVECFGAGWPNGRVSYEEMEQIFRKTKINLNISNSVSYDIRFILSSASTVKNFLASPKRFEQTKARNFEIPLAGGFQLSNYVLGLERYLSIGSEVAIYTGIDECFKQVEYFLNNETEIRKIATNGFEAAKNRHKYIHRIEAILNFIGQ